MDFHRWFSEKLTTQTSTTLVVRSKPRPQYRSDSRGQRVSEKYMPSDQVRKQQVLVNKRKGLLPVVERLQVQETTPWGSVKTKLSDPEHFLC